MIEDLILPMIASTRGRFIICFHCRLSSLLLFLPSLRSLSAPATEELFFAGLIGNVQIDSIIPYILRMDTSEFSMTGVGYPSSPVPETPSDPVPESHPFSPENVAAIFHNQYGSNGLLSEEPKKFSSQSRDSLMTASSSAVSSS